MNKTILLTLLVLLGFSDSNAQTITEQLKRNAREFQLNEQLVNNWKASSRHSSNNSNLEYVYYQAYVNNIPVENQIFTVIAKDGKVLKINKPSHRIDFQKENNSSSLRSNTITATTATQKAFLGLGLRSPQLSSTRSNSRTEEGVTMFAKNNQTSEDITAKKVYLLESDGSLTLAWKVFIYTKDGNHAYDSYINASTGQFIKKEDGVVHCSFGDHSTHDHKHRISPIKLVQNAKSATNTNAATATYNVFDIYVESPLHGERTLVSDPWTNVGDINSLEDKGWHSDGTNTYTSTRGNNVDAYVDWNGDHLPTNGDADRAVSPDLNFDFTFDDSRPQSENKDAAVTNLFFWSNITHDVLYLYGFDEAAGNFQKNNFDKGGLGQDYVLAQAQDGGGTDNANFAAPADGNYGRMQMYNWTSPQALAVNSPVAVAGNYAMKESNFSTANKLENVGPVTGNIVLALDTENNTSEACTENPISNTTELAGKIAVIYRGSCSFSDKVLNAQNAGAIGVLVINNQDGSAIVMGGEDNTVTIPAVMVSKADGETIIAELANGDVEITMDATNTNFYPDGDFDNGVIVHEYGHGLSIRLTGGGDNVSCLRNDEQMGEGWSDFVGLMLTTDWANAKEEDVRGIGAYPSAQGITGSGIRRYPYSTDFGVNPFTYKDVASDDQAVPHGVGSVWGAMLWEMLWEIEKIEPFNSNIYSREGANGIALQLVVEGLKLQPCSPGFVDGRDAILLADEMLYDGKYKCAIWKAFARRGLGKSADQGSSADKTDGVEAFDLPVECINIACDDVSIEKTADKDITFDGETIVYTIKATNNCTVPNTVDITDPLPKGVEYIAESGGVFENGVVKFSEVTLAPNTSQEFTFSVKVLDTAKAGTPANVVLNETVENGQGDFTFTLETETSNEWVISSTTANGGSNSFYSTTQGSNSAAALVSSFIDLPADQPSELTFYHSYILDGSETSAYDLGLVEVSIDGTQWFDLGDYFTENGYNSSASILTDYYGRKAFSGNSNGFIKSTIDLSVLAGQSVQFRWLVGTDEYATLNDEGWYVDDIKVATVEIAPIDKITNIASLSIQTLPITSDSAVTQLGTAEDSELPSTPINVTSSNVDIYSLDLSWDPSTDNVGIKEYQVFQDGVLITTTTDTTISIYDLQEKTSYSYTVVAIDVNNLESQQSEVHTVTTLENPDKTPPSIPTGLVDTNTDSSSTTISWAPSTDDVAVTGYNIYQDGVLIGTTTDTTLDVTNLSPDTDYNFTVTSFDKSGNESEESEILLVTTTNAKETTVTINTDIFGSETSWVITNETGETVMSGGGYSGNNTYVTTENLPNGCYTFTVSDSYGDGMGSTGTYEINVNGEVVATGGGDFGESESKEFCVDAEAPSTPIEVTAGNETGTTITLDWSDSTDNVGVTGYNIYIDDVFLTTVTATSNFVAGEVPTTYTVTGLTEQTTYDFKISAIDEAGNESRESTIVTATTTLPVTFASFKAKAEGEDAILTWTTVTEINNDRFEIEKSTNGSTFEKIGEVSGNGTTNHKNEYNYVDQNNTNGTVYYRLRQVDYDGSYDYSAIVSIIFTNATSIKTYPHPVVDYLTIENAPKGSRYSIFNINGKLVKQGNVTSIIEVNDLHSGEYIFQIVNNNKQVHKEVLFIK